MKKPSLLVIFLTVFVDLIGFGIVLPLLPTYAKSFGASALIIGALMASYSAMQFLFAPMWGAWSDRVGRRPALLVSTAGNAISYSIFALASGMEGRHALWIIFASRIFAGICGANITVAQAYIADITPPEDRSKKMGLIGMAFGLGFIVGPVLAVVGQNLFGKTGPGWIAAAICAFNFALAAVRLPESWKPGAAPVRRTRFAQVTHVLRQPVIGFLIAVFFLATFGFTCFESTLGILIAHNFQLDEHSSHNTNAILFSFAGIIGAFVQAGPIGRLVKKLGEPKLIAGSLVIFAIGLAPMPWIRSSGSTLSWGSLVGPHAGPWWTLLLFVGFIAIGSGLTRPPLFGLLSNLAARDEQGATLGVAQSAGSLARIAGPLFAGFFFDRHPSWPYVLCAAIALLTGIVAWSRLVNSPVTNRTTALPA